MNHLIAEDITRLAEAAAHRVINQAEAAAQRIEARAKAKDVVKESIRRTFADMAEMICGFLDEDQAEDGKLAASLRAGEGIIPPATQLSAVTIDPETILDPPRTPRLSPEERLASAQMSEPPIPPEDALEASGARVREAA